MGDKDNSRCRLCCIIASLIALIIAVVIGVFWCIFYCRKTRSRSRRNSDDISSPVLGLPNSYLNCYLNSTSQCLFATPDFMRLQKNKKGPLAEMLRRLEEKHDIVTLKSFGERVMAEFGTMLCPFVAFLNLVNALAAEEDQLLLDHYERMFGVDVEYEVKCENGHLISARENHNFALSLPIPPVRSRNLDVFECLEELTRSKNAGFSCDTCGGSNSTDTAQIARLSPILVIHFQRYINGGKDDRAIEFPEVIDISEKLYEVYGVVCHYGTQRGGHYYAYVKYNGVWYEANDLNVAKIGSEKPSCKEAYMLFCKKV